MATKNARIDSYFINNCYSALKLVQPLMKAAAQSLEEGDMWHFFAGQPDGAWQWVWQSGGGMTCTFIPQLRGCGVGARVVL